MQPRELAPGIVIAGEFRIVRPLSQGGMGAVYVALQLGTGHERALKVMHPGLVEDPDLRRRFEQEARVGARLRSDHVVQVVGAGVDPATQVPYLAMELLEGQDLASVLAERGVLSPAEVAEIFAQACHALAEAHAAGIVHRDLKPENVFLCHPRREGVPFTVKILDFGIAKVVADAHLSTTAAVGTPMWMAPEQTEHGAPVSAATDVWALGLLAFRLLVGKSYWRGANPESLSPTALLREVVLDPLVPASARAAQYGLADRLPIGFDAWFARCVARDAAARFRDAGELRAALAPILAGTGSTVVSVRPRDGAVPPSSGTAPTERFSTTQGSALAAPEDDLPPPVPSGRGPAPMLAGLGLVVALGFGAVVLATRSGGGAGAAGAQPSVTPSAPGVVPRCPGGMAAYAGGPVTIKSETTEVAGFCLDLREVSVADYGACVGKGCVPPSPTVDWPGATDDEKKKWAPFCNAGRADRQTHPINCVTASQAAAYCKAQGKRLPTEAEWQWAAQGERDARLYPWGTSAPEGHACWSGVNDRLGGGGGTCPVGASPGGETAQGVLDLSGNVWEWTVTPWAAGTAEFVIRGGGWADDDASLLRTGHRDHRSPLSRSATIGFRCAFP